MALQPNDAVAWFNLAYVLQQADQDTEAEHAFRCALSFNERMDRAWYGLGISLMRKQKFDDAVAALRKTTALQPMSPHGWFRLAEAHTALGQADEAAKVLAHLKQIEPRVAAHLAHRVLAVQPEWVRADAPKVEPVLTHAAH